MPGSLSFERPLAALLSGLALVCGGWALWPALSPSPRLPVVTHAALPAPLSADPAPVYATTPSIRPLISGQLNLNTASEEQLEALPSIGPALAARLIAARPYRSLADLDAVRGVGPVLLAKLTPLVRF
ncbi:ComEA family DNA-binding protein [Deinococcus rubellus]|uniref:Helix-hairpin-helix domain-containing protein n=1 Tax=Deinococcus rubellus TaxID=1889240 RepID=A0ABY5YHW4_9DEIO|nr:helix-hairpin-helix domain-containing protein [Deinococcus rubellus]UWX64654.1 helix-hairpin-helix domain-containing protein [Deinococcus rubellus]